MIPSDLRRQDSPYYLVCTYVRSVLLVGTIHPTMPDRTCTLYTRSRARRRTYSGALAPSWLRTVLTQRSIANGVTTPLLSKPLAMSGRMASCARAVSSPCRKSRSHASATPPSPVTRFFDDGKIKHKVCYTLVLVHFLPSGASMRKMWSRCRESKSRRPTPTAAVSKCYATHRT